MVPSTCSSSERGPDGRAGALSRFIMIGSACEMSQRTPSTSKRSISVRTESASHSHTGSRR